MTGVLRCAHCAATVIAMTDGSCPACARACAGPVVRAPLPDEPFQAPTLGGGMHQGIPDRREEWVDLRDRCRRDYHFAMRWTAVWFVGALLCILLFHVLLLAGVVLAELLAGLVGRVRDGRRYRRLRDHGLLRGWT